VSKTGGISPDDAHGSPNAQTNRMSKGGNLRGQLAAGTTAIAGILLAPGTAKVFKWKDNAAFCAEYEM